MDVLNDGKVYECNIDLNIKHDMMYVVLNGTIKVKSLKAKNGKKNDLNKEMP